MTTLTLSFERIGSADLPSFGGKGANLGEPSRAGFEVPPGFCVTTEAFVRFMSGAEEDTYGRLDGLAGDDLEQLGRVGAAVRAYLEARPLPDEVALADEAPAPTEADEGTVST